MRHFIIAILSVLLLYSLVVSSNAITITINGDKVRVNGVKYEFIGSSPLQAALDEKFVIDGGATDIELTGVDSDHCALELTWWEYEEGDASFYIEDGVLKSRTLSGKPAALRSVKGTIPLGIDLEFDVGSGNVSVSGMDSSNSIIFDSGSGDLLLFDSERLGDVVFDSGSGDQELRNIDGATNIDLDVGSGDISLTAVTSVGEITVDTGSGDTRLTNCQMDSFNADTGSGDVYLTHCSIRVRDIETGLGEVFSTESDAK